MLERRFSLLMGTFLLSVLATACGGANLQLEAPPSPPSAPVTLSTDAVPAVTVNLTLNPGEIAAICAEGAVKISGGIERADLLDSLRDQDVRMKANFDSAIQSQKPTDAEKLQECKVQATNLSFQVEGRFGKTQSLCEDKNGAGSGAAFKTKLQPTVDKIKNALAGAAGATTLADCTKNAGAAKNDFEAFVTTANESCSSEIQCLDAVAKFCEKPHDFAANSLLASCVRGNVSVARARSFDSTRAGERDVTARSPLAGAALQSAILTGAADFFVERAEQEMSLFAVEVVGSQLCKEDSPAREFLPKTCELIGKPIECKNENATPEEAEKKKCVRKEELENYAVDGSVLGPTPGAIRAAAKADLEALPENVVTKVAEVNPHLACAAAFGWGVADEVAHGADLVTLLKDPTPILERELVSTHCDKEIDNLKNLAQQIKRHLTGNPAAVADTLRSGDFERLVATERSLTVGGAGTTLGPVGEMVAEVLRRLVELDRAIVAYRANPKPETRVVMVIAAIQTVEPIMAYLTRAAKYREDVHTAVEFFAQILNRQYAEAVVTASTFESAKILPPNTRNLVGLAAGLAQAESSDDVRKTLSDAALPLGSWRRKNAPRLGATLTGMVGGFLAYEMVTERPNPGQKVTSGMSFAPSLLVGADMHHGFTWGRVGLHFNVLDLGALASIRLDTPKVEDEDTGDTVESGAEAEAEPNVEFEQVFAPGALLYFGYGPFNIGPSVTFVPSLRPYQEASGEFEPLSVVRVGGVLAVDVSVLPLF